MCKGQVCLYTAGWRSAGHCLTIQPIREHRYWLDLDWADSGNFRDAVGNALYTFREFRDSFEALQKRGMDQDMSWDNAAKTYEEVLVAAKYQW